MKRIFLLGAVSVIVLVFGMAYLFYRHAPEQFVYEKGKVVINSHEFAVDIAESEEKRSRGLAGRETLGENEGMLFVFEGPAYPVFWMKGMRIPIDIIWISGGKVAGFAENALPEKIRETPALFRPPGAVEYVLEVKAGTVQALDIKPGTIFAFQ